jgi:hypothetical protein
LNIDELVVRDSSLPLFGSCGGCGGAPTFAGIVSAVDDDPCADSGVTLAWSGAPSWGTGDGGSYVVYRDTTPGFVPSAANRIASGLSGTTWTDAAAPTGMPLYYVVRAENDETCSSGPGNAGMIDENLVYATVVNHAAQPAPGNVGPTLTVDGVNDAHARLTWAPTAGAAVYHVYSSSAPDNVFDRIAQPGDPLYDDVGALGDYQDRYYLVRATDACGNESDD